MPPIKPANAAAKASDFTVLVIEISLSLVEPRLAARDVRFDCDRIAAGQEAIQEEKRFSFATLSLSCAFLRTAHWSDRWDKGYGQSEGTKKLRFGQSPTVSGSDCLQYFALKYLVIDV